MRFDSDHQYQSTENLLSHFIGRYFEGFLQFFEKKEKMEEEYKI
jgi:hypothetical protein